MKRNEKQSMNNYKFTNDIKETKKKKILKNKERINYELNWNKIEKNILI